jgi:Pyridoxamine 5'-phosphate oxidase
MYSLPLDVDFMIWNLIYWFLCNRAPTATSDSLWLATDARQDKVAQLLSIPNYEAVFWLPNSGSQWRIRGEAAILGGPNDSASRTKIQQHLQASDGWTFDEEIKRGFNGLDKFLKKKFGVEDGGSVEVYSGLFWREGMNTNNGAFRLYQQTFGC